MAGRLFALVLPHRGSKRSGRKRNDQRKTDAEARGDARSI